MDFVHMRSFIHCSKRLRRDWWFKCKHHLSLRMQSKLDHMVTTWRDIIYICMLLESNFKK